MEQLGREGISELFRVADLLQPVARRQKISRILEGAVLANLFFEPSTRTRVSFGAAFSRLGGSVCDTTGFTFSSMAKGETIADTSRVISGYADVMVVRHPEKGSVAQFAQASPIPVINGGDGPGEHPTQALLDLYTIQREFARLGKEVDGSHIALIGDLKHGRTVHSLVKLLSIYSRMTFTLVSPKSLAMPAEIVDGVRAAGHRVEESDSPASVLHGADVLYATRIQKERIQGALEGLDERFIINRALLSGCRPDLVLMHPLPRDGSPGAIDLSTDLDSDPRLAIFKQTDNGIPVRMALFAFALGVENHVEQSFRPATWWSP